MVALAAYSDDFSVGGPSPSPRWTFLGSGGSTVSVNYQVPGKLHLAIDTSANRLCWTGSLSCLRLLEPAPPGDFRADLRIDTMPPPGPSQVNAVGLLAYQDSLNYIRFEIQPAAAPWEYRITANAFISGIGYPDLASCENLEDLSAPVFLRVSMSQGVWTLGYSTDSLTYQFCGSFSQPLATAWLGPQVESDGTLGNFTHADFGSLRVAVPRRPLRLPTPTPAPVDNALDAEVVLPPTTTPDSGNAL